MRIKIYEPPTRLLTTSQTRKPLNTSRRVSPGTIDLCLHSSVFSISAPPKFTTAMPTSLRGSASNYLILLPIQQTTSMRMLCRSGQPVAEHDNLSLPDVVRLVRGETIDDPRPNKHLFELPLPSNPVVRNSTVRWNEIVQHGFI